MSETKFTPGPWITSNGLDVIYSSCHVSLVIAEIGGFEHPSRAGMSDANAHLIAAAPELYEALNSPVINRLLGEIEDGTIDPALMWSLAQQWMELRDVALAKARGDA